MTTKNIRPYGPGKFSTILDAYVYDVTFVGCDDEISSEQTDRWFGLMRRGRSIFKDHDPLLESLNEDEQEQLTSCAGVIVSSDSYGFVYVSYYDTSEELDKDWDAIRAEYDTDEDEDGESDNG